MHSGVSALPRPAHGRGRDREFDEEREFDGLRRDVARRSAGLAGASIDLRAEVAPTGYNPTTRLLHAWRIQCG